MAECVSCRLRSRRKWLASRLRQRLFQMNVSAVRGFPGTVLRVRRVRPCVVNLTVCGKSDQKDCAGCAEKHEQE